MSVKLDIDIRTSVPGFALKISQLLDVRGITAVFGPSGAGKTTLLRLIAGFELPDSGRIVMDDIVLDMPAHERSTGYMFQDARLFDHLSVRGNLEFADKRSQNGRADIPFDDVVDAFDLAPLLGRSPASLSGGERKRAALARTILTRPKLLLLDEPLSGLDRMRKREILPFIESLSRRFGLPCLYVSHDIEEVSQIADDIIVLGRGKVRAYGSAMDVLGRLDLEPLASRTNPSILFEGKITEQDARLALTHISIGGTNLTLPLKQRLAIGDVVRLRIRAKDVAIATVRPIGVSIRNIIEAEILDIANDKGSAFADILLDASGAHIRSRITRAAAEDLALMTGMTVFALIKTMSFEGRLT